MAALALAPAGAQPCEVCNRRLPENHWVYDGKSCCSEQCADTLRPKCAGCRRAIEGEYVSANGKEYCSSACFEKTLPACEICRQPILNGFTITRHRYCARCVEESPVCFSCGLPAAFPVRLADGREICITCDRWAVKTQELAQRNYEMALRQLEAWTGLRLATVPELVLVDRDEMQRLSGSLRKSDSPVPVRGLYSRQLTVTTRRIFGFWKEEKSGAAEKIYIVDHLSDEVFLVAAMHELMHDLVNEHFPRLEKAPLWVHEGISQQAAAEYCRRRNLADPLHGIENCDDPDYGDGYRYIHSLTGFGGWHALRRWMDSADPAALPKNAPN